MNEPLYTTDILRLAVEAAGYPRLSAPDGSSSGRTPVCGSTITLDIAKAADGTVAAVGFDIQACALGQASSAILAHGIVGRTPAQLAEVAQQLADWLAGSRDTPPDWPLIEQLAPARSRSGRHEAILLGFRAAAKAAEAA